MFLFLILYFSVLVAKDCFEKGTFQVNCRFVVSLSEKFCKSTKAISAAGQSSL